MFKIYFVIFENHILIFEIGTNFKYKKMNFKYYQKKFQIWENMEIAGIFLY